MPGAPIDGGFFYHKITGAKAVILYPALTTPCMVDVTGRMTVIIALHEDCFGKLQEYEKVQFTVGQPLLEKTAVKFHAQLLLVPWGNGHKQKYLTEEDGKLFYNGINAWRYSIYGDSDAAVTAFTSGSPADYKGYYLGELKQIVTTYSDELGRVTKAISYAPHSVSIYQTCGEKPFGILAASAVKMYYEAGFKQLFQLEFSNFPIAKSSPSESKPVMHELIWLNAPHPPEHVKHNYEMPSDTLLVRNFESQINGLLLEKNKETEPQTILTDASKEPEKLDLYRLLNLTARQDPEWQQKAEDTGVNLAELAYLTQVGGELLYSYHPVCFLKKNIETIGAISDLHISSRQALYKLVDAQVIPGVEAEESSFIGQVAHEYLASTCFLMGEIGTKSDLLLIAGDIYDHIRNLHPQKCADKIAGATTGKTAKLWHELDFLARQIDDLEKYPKYIDGLMMLELILTHYNKLERPVFFVAGNHEGYREPYGISPRVTAIGKVNEGIPADHNLTIYEAALLYGEKYGDIGRMNNFSGKALQWLYQVFTPWSDFRLSHGNINLIGLGWGSGEDFLKSMVMGGGTLPRATASLTTGQLALVESAAGEHEQKTNVLFSHFTHINYAPDMPLNERSNDRHLTQTGKMAVEDQCNIGSYTQNQSRMFDLMEANKIQVSIAGHSHRGGVYLFTNQGQGMGLANRYITTQAVLPANHINLANEKFQIGEERRSAALVCPSGGPMSCQNLGGEFLDMGMEKPGGLILRVNDSEVDFVYWEKGGNGEDKQPAIDQPRLAVLLAYLHDMHDLKPLLPVETQKPGPGYGLGPVALSGQINIGADGKATAIVSPRLRLLFSGIPIKAITLHAVPTDGSGSEELAINFTPVIPAGSSILDRMVYTNQELNNSSLDVDEILFDYNTDTGNALKYRLRGLEVRDLTLQGGAADGALKDFLAFKDDNENVQFFVSIKLNGQCSGEPANLLSRYNTASPWCLPARFLARKSGGYTIYISFQELPNFFKMKQFTEFDMGNNSNAK